jgi:DNA-binding CsgD family transcriptional regulator
MIYLEIMRSRSQASYSLEERRFIESLLPHLQRALHCNNHLWRLAITQEMLDHLSCGVLAVDSDRRLLFANKLARKELDQQNGLMVRSGELCTSAPANDNRLKLLISDAATATHAKDRGTAGALTIRRGGRLLPMWLVAMPLSRPLRKVVGQENEVALLFVGTPEHSGKILETALSKLYRLTPRERKLVQMILEGYTVIDAATELGISINTARTHMKRIYTKTRTERQTDLVRVLLAGPVG